MSEDGIGVILFVSRRLHVHQSIGGTAEVCAVVCGRETFCFMTPGRFHIALSLSLILCLRLVGCSFFSNHQFLKPFFAESVQILDGTLQALVDRNTPEVFVAVFLNDEVNGLPWSSLGRHLGLLRDIWCGWRRRNVVPPAVAAACLLFQRLVLGCGHREVSTEQFYDSFMRVPPLTFWTAEEV